jgi:hypothetical protein
LALTPAVPIQTLPPYPAWRAARMKMIVPLTVLLIFIILYTMFPFV